MKSRVTSILVLSLWSVAAAAREPSPAVAAAQPEAFRDYSVDIRWSGAPEMGAVPFKTLRFGRAESQTWGFNIRRYITRRQEQSLWKPMLRKAGSVAVYRVSDFGTIRGMLNLAAGGRYQFKPYTLLRAQPTGRSDTSGPGDLGGGFKISLTSGLVADLTVNTDFAEVEADQQQLNLDRFKLYYPKQCEFPLEGASLVDF